MPFGLGPFEMVLFGGLAVLLFGSRLPEVARSMGKSFSEFKQGMSGVQQEWNSAVYSEPTDSLDYADPEEPGENSFSEPQPEGDDGADPRRDTA